MFRLDLPKQLQKYTLLSQESVVAEVENCEFLKGHSGRRNLTNADVRAEKWVNARMVERGGWSALDAVEHGGENMRSQKT